MPESNQGSMLARKSPTLEGFRAMFRRPAFGLAEVSWRWAFGGAATILLLFAFFEYLDTLPVTPSDLFLLRTRQPSLISQALAHIFRGSAWRFVHAAILLALLLSLGWIVLATLGRSVTTRGLVGYLCGEETAAAGFRMKSMAGLNFLRAAAALAAAVGILGAMLLGALASPDKDPAPGSAMLVFLMVLMFVGLAWALTNWFLSLASVFVVTGGHDTFGAIGAAVGLCRERLGPVVAASSWFGLAHGVAYFVFSSVVAFPLIFAGVLPAGVVIGGVLMVSLVYFFVVDFLYIGRLAAYVYIIKGPEPEEIQIVPLLPPVSEPPAPIDEAASVDREELILSDVPGGGQPGSC